MAQGMTLFYSFNLLGNQYSAVLLGFSKKDKANCNRVQLPFHNVKDFIKGQFQ
jgi:hypothetical protein